MKTWQGDCAHTERIPFTSIQKLRGKWTEFVMYSRWENNQDGRFVIYLDGVKVVDYKGRTLTIGKEKDNYVKVGIGGMYFYQTIFLYKKVANYY